MEPAIPQPPAAPFLFSDLQESQNDPTAPGTVFTGERLATQRPEIYREVVTYLGQGMGIREICRRLRVHHRTVQAVSIREGQTIDTMRRELGARALGLAGLAMERLEEQITGGTIKPGELAMTVGILVDKGQVLTGGVTGRVERIERHHVEKELEAFLAEVETVEITGLSSEELSAIEPPAAGPAGLLGAGSEATDLGTATGSTDSESTALPVDSRVEPDSATASATSGAGPEAGIDADQATRGAGGSRIRRGGGEIPTDPGKTKF